MRDRSRGPTPLERLSAKIKERKEKVERKRKLSLDISRLDNDIVSIDEEIKGILLAHFGDAASVPIMEHLNTEEADGTVRKQHQGN